jgi:hypothetical protein
MKKPMKAAGKISPLKPGRQDFRLPHLRELSLSYEGRNEIVSMRPPDISRHGMFINTGTRFPEGSVLKLRFRLAQSGTEVETRCEVRYCLGGVGIGVEFLNLSPQCARAIENEILRHSTGKRNRPSHRPANRRSHRPSNRLPGRS